MKGAYKLGIAGAHSTGKTTFLDLLSSALSPLSVRVKRVKDLAREARGLGFPILRDHTFESTLWIVTRGISLELEVGLDADVVLVDRPVPDALGYLYAALEHRGEFLPTSERDYLETLVSNHVATYSRMLLTSIDPSMPIDTTKERDQDPEFRRMAANGVAQIFERLGVSHTRLESGGGPL